MNNNHHYEEEDYALAERLSRLPEKVIDSLSTIVKYLDTPLLEELLSPDTTLDRLYELYVIFREDAAIEFQTLTMVKIIQIDHGLKKEKIDATFQNLGI